MIRVLLVDRDGTLIVDKPDICRPDDVVLLPTARSALDRARACAMVIAVVTNQPRIARGTLSPDEFNAICARIAELAGPIDAWFVCPHEEHAGCTCRKPAPGLIRAAAAKFGVSTSNCVLVGDVGNDVEAARAAGAHAILVPTSVTRPQEVLAAPLVARSLLEAVELVLRDAA
jgi:histidinol-phosphate phosphatase family protein